MTDAPFTMAGLAAVLDEWLWGRELAAFERFGRFAAVPEGLLDARAWPERPFPAVLIEGGEFGDYWFSWHRGGVLRPGKVPVISAGALKGFMGDFCEHAAGRVNPHWRRGGERGSKVATLGGQRRRGL